MEGDGELVDIQHRVGGVVLDAVLHAASEDAGTLIIGKSLEISAQRANIVVDRVFILCSDQVCSSSIVASSKCMAVLIFPAVAKQSSAIFQSSCALD